MTIQATPAFIAGTGSSAAARQLDTARADAPPAPPNAQAKAAQLRGRMGATSFEPAAARSSFETLARNAPADLRQRLAAGTAQLKETVADQQVISHMSDEAGARSLRTGENVGRLEDLRRALGFGPSEAAQVHETAQKAYQGLLKRDLSLMNDIHGQRGEMVSQLRDYLHGASPNFRATEQKRDQLDSARSALGHVDDQLSSDPQAKTNPNVRQALTDRYNARIDSLVAAGSQVVTAADKLPPTQSYDAMVQQTAAKLKDLGARYNAQATSIHNSIYTLGKMLAE
jgi:hypothetical protein